MKRQSDKRRRLVGECRAAREGFRLEYMICFVCLNAWRSSPVPTLDVHEIARGCHRELAYRDPRAWLLLCRLDHEQMTASNGWDIPMQLALKKIRDPERYDLEFVNLIRGRQTGAITEEQVEECVAEIRGGWGGVIL